MRRAPTVLLAIALALVAGACAGDEQAERGAITVFAAASLTDAFGELGDRFEADHPGTEVTFNFAASSALAEQVAQGAPADVFASADQANLDEVADLVDEPAVFATNALAIIGEDGNPEAVDELADLASPDLAVVLCADVVPCGRYAQQVLHGAGVAVTPKSLEENVKGVVTKVSLGEADAGIVYVTDALAADGDTDRVEIPEDRNAVATYPIAVVRDASNVEVARAFVEFVRSDQGQEILESFGFGAP